MKPKFRGASNWYLSLRGFCVPATHPVVVIEGAGLGAVQAEVASVAVSTVAKAWEVTGKQLQRNPR